jgi:hypothetical protein
MGRVMGDIECSHNTDRTVLDPRIVIARSRLMRRVSNRAVVFLAPPRVCRIDLIAQNFEAFRHTPHRIFS